MWIKEFPKGPQLHGTWKMAYLLLVGLLWGVKGSVRHQMCKHWFRERHSPLATCCICHLHKSNLNMHRWLTQAAPVPNVGGGCGTTSSKQLHKHVHAAKAHVCARGWVCCACVRVLCCTCPLTRTIWKARTKLTDTRALTHKQTLKCVRIQSSKLYNSDTRQNVTKRYLALKIFFDFYITFHDILNRLI